MRRPSLDTGVLAGLVALDERLPTGHSMKVLRLASWLLILLGVTSLAGGISALATALRALGAALPVPQWAWQFLPRPAALVLHRLQKRAELDDGLPLSEPLT